MVRRKTASATAREQVKLFRFIKSRRETAWLYPFGYDNKETAHFNCYTVVVHWPNYRVKHYTFRRRFLCNVDVSSFSISCSLYFPQCSVVPQIIAPKLFCFLSVTGHLTLSPSFPSLIHSSLCSSLPSFGFLHMNH